MVRIKNRYLLFNILYPQPIPSTSNTQSKHDAQLSFHALTPAHVTPALLLKHVRAHIATHFGDTGLGLTTSSLKIIYLSRATSTVILRCPRAHVRIVWAALTYMTSLPERARGEGGLECVVRVVRVSGTIRKSEEELIRRAKMEIVRARGAEGEGDMLGRLLGDAQSGKGGNMGGDVEDVDVADLGTEVEEDYDSEE